MTEIPAAFINASGKDSRIHWIVIVILSQCFKVTAQSIPTTLQPPHILQKGSEIWYKEEGKLELKCQGDRPVVWSHSKLNLATDLRANILTSSYHLSELTLSNLTLNDSGVVFCRYNKPALSSYVDAIYISVTKEGDKGKGPSGTVKTVLSVIIFLCIALLTGLLVWRLCIECRKRNRSTKNISKDPNVKEETENFLDKEPTIKFYNGAIECIDPEQSISEQADLLPFESHWELPRDRLQLGPQLGSGAFGRVVKAEAIGLVETEPSTTVAVKMLKPNADESHLKALMSELKIMAHLGKHINVVNLVGACTKQLSKSNELLVIVEYCKYGSLLSYIRRYNKRFVDQIVPNGLDNDMVDPNITTIIRPQSIADNGGGGGNATYGENGTSSGDITTSTISHQSSRYDLHKLDSNREPGGGQSITTTDLLCWAFQIARGMEYLSARKVIHGDLALRNVLLTESHVVKICDFGLAKDMYKDYNYIMSTKGGNFPVKWMALESIHYGELSTESDCWSFGVVLWELFSLGKIPYPGIKADEELIKNIDKGYRMQKPEYAPSGIYKMMLECWAHDKTLRPPFPGLVNMLGYMFDKKLKDYLIELNAEYERRNMASAGGLPQQCNNAQVFAELDSYGYLKPTEMTKTKQGQDSSSSGGTPSMSTDLPNNERGSNNYVPDPTATKQNHTDKET